MNSQFIIIFAGGSKNDLLLKKKDPPLSEAWLAPCTDEFFWCFHVFIGAGTNSPFVHALKSTLMSSYM